MYNENYSFSYKKNLCIFFYFEVCYDFNVPKNVDVKLNIDINRYRTRAVGLFFVCMISYDNRIKQYINNRVNLNKNIVSFCRLNQSVKWFINIRR